MIASITLHHVKALFVSFEYVNLDFFREIAMFVLNLKWVEQFDEKILHY